MCVQVWATPTLPMTLFIRCVESCLDSLECPTMNIDMGIWIWAWIRTVCIYSCFRILLLSLLPLRVKNSSNVLLFLYFFFESMDITPTHGALAGEKRKRQRQTITSKSEDKSLQHLLVSKYNGAVSINLNVCYVQFSILILVSPGQYKLSALIAYACWHCFYHFYDGDNLSEQIYGRHMPLKSLNR